MDAELVERAKRGDQEAFAALARGSYNRLYRVAHNILGDIDQADDAAQQAVVDIWRKLPQLRDVQRFDAWSYRILVNDCYSEARKAQRWLPGHISERDEDRAAADAISGVVYRDQLERGFCRLPVEQRAVVVLHHYLGLPLHEVADVLDIPTGTAHSRLNRAMTGLRAALEADARSPHAEAAPEQAR